MELQSWLASANDPGSDFPIQNLPYGVFSSHGRDCIGVAIGDQILDLYSCATNGLLDGVPEAVVAACAASVLNPLMALGSAAWSGLRRRLTALLDANQTNRETQDRVSSHLIPLRDAVMRLPAAIGDYTDFYSSIYHATRVGQLYRPDNPLLPNYKHIPIGYHGRASSIVTSGETIKRPCGQIKARSGEPVFAPTQSLDYELEVGLLVGSGNALGQHIPIAEAEQQIFGLCLVNDWSARDIQAWEYQPLGPFLAKSFATTISPWVVPLEALAPYRVPAFARSDGDPVPLAYLKLPSPESAGIDLALEVFLQSARMRQTGAAPVLLSTSNLRYLYWSIEQFVTHHASNGCNLRPGDLLATGTISGPDAGSEGCLLEMQHRAEPIRLPNGETRTYLEDGDEISFRAHCQREGLPRVGFGACIGRIAGSSGNGSQ